MQRPFPAYEGTDPYVFVCYAHDDAAQVYAQIAQLKQLGFNLWYDEGISAGSSWRDEVALAISRCGVFLFFVSIHSVASPNCIKEVSFALNRDRRFVVVYLETTQLPAGLELSLSDIQAIGYDLAPETYWRKLSSGISALMPRGGEVVQQSAPAEESVGPSIAILPLVNRSSDPDNEYLCDGIAEELICGLAEIDGLRVASQLSSFAYRKEQLDARLLGQRLGVAHLLSGSVQKSGNRLRIGFLLSRCGDGSTLWSARYDRELNDIFELQGEVAATVIEAMRMKLNPSQRRQLKDVGTRDGEAYESYLQGIHAARRGTRESLLNAVAHLQRAVHLDPDYARVHWWLYFCFWRLIGVGEPRQEMELRGEKALERARNAGFLPPVPWVKALRDLKPGSRPDQRTLVEEACTMLRRPDPDWRGFEYVQLGECLLAAGFDHAACAFYEHYLNRVTHDLSATWIPSRFRSILTQIDRCEQAIEYLDRTSMVGKTLVYARTGQFEHASRHLVKESRSPSFNIYRFCLMWWRGDKEAALSYFNGFDPDTLWLLERYWVMFLTGDLEIGLDLLEQDVELGAHPSVFRSNLREVLLPATVATLESHPRFQALLHRFGIDDAWCGKLVAMINEVSDVTGITVTPRSTG